MNEFVTFYEGLAAFQLQNGKYTYVDKYYRKQAGEYKRAFAYSEGFAAVQLDKDDDPLERWAFRDKEGKLQEGRYLMHIAIVRALLRFNLKIIVGLL